MSKSYDDDDTYIAYRAHVRPENAAYAARGNRHEEYYHGQRALERRAQADDMQRLLDPVPEIEEGIVSEASASVQRNYQRRYWEVMTRGGAPKP